ncbi:translocation/assembly module TamB domain-containing protein [Wenyingzhuangia sp. IMCC45467]
MSLKSSNIFKKAFHFFKWLFVGFLVLFVAVVLFIRSSWGQNIIKNKVTDFVATKIDTKFSIEKVYLTFSGNLKVEELYLEDQQKDTLLYSKELEVSIAVMPIVTQNNIYVKSVEWSGLVAKILKPEKTHQYNFNYIINAFVDSNTSKEPEVKTKVNNPIEIKVGEVHFSDFDLLFKDEVMGIDTRLKLGSLNVAFGNQFNINTFHFPIKKLALTNVDVKYIQNKAFPTSEESKEESVSPFIKIENVSLKNIHACYNNKIANSLVDVNLGLFNVNNALVDLANQNVDIETIELNNTEAKLAFISDEIPLEKDTLNTQNKTNFEWPNWKVKVDELAFENNTIALKTGNKTFPKNVFNPQNFKITNNNILIQDFELGKERVEINIKDISFVEKSGFELKELALKGVANNKKTTISKLAVKTNTNQLNAQVDIGYSSINNFINQPENTLFNVTVNHVALNVKDAYYFSPELKGNEYVQKFSEHAIIGNIVAKGVLKNIDIPTINLKWGEKTSIELTAKIKDVLSDNNLSFEVPNFRFKTDRKSVLSFVNEQDLGMIIPNTILLTSNTKGSLQALTTNTVLTLPKGKLTVKGKLKNSKVKGFDGQIKVSNLELGKLINNAKIGLIDLESNIAIQAKEMSSLKAKVTTTFNNLVFDGYNYKPLNIKADINQGEGVVVTDFKDDHLDFNTKTNIKLDSLVSNIQTAINLKGIDLKGLQLTNQNIKARLNVKANFKGNANEFTFSSETDNGLIIYNEEAVPVSPIKLSASATKDSTNVSIDSGLLTLRVKGNANPEQITKAIDNHLSSYFVPKGTKLDTVVKNTQLKAELSITQDPILDKVFLEGLSNFDPITFKLLFNEADHKLVSTFNIPFVEYQESSIKNAIFSLNTLKNDFTLDFKIDNVKHDPVNIDNINLQGKLLNDVVYLDFSTADETEKIININSEITKNDTLVKVHLNPKNVILNRKNWQIPSENEIVFKNNAITSSDVRLTRNNQQVSFDAEVNKENHNKLAIDFKEFNLLSLFAFLNDEHEIVSGLLSGHVNINQFKEEQDITSKIDIKELKVFNNVLGNLVLKAETNSTKNYDVHLTLQEKEAIDLVVDGSYNTSETKSPFNLKVNLNKLSLKKVEAFGKEFISNASGSISANFNMEGSMENPVYNGSLNFNNAKLKVNSFNTNFTFPNETIKVDNSSVLLNKFTVLDADKNSFVLDGKVGTKEVSNPQFDLSVKTKNLQVLNSTEKDNDLYYGKLFFDADVKIGGDLNIPKVTGTLQIDKNSNLTYVIPESTIEAVEREGVVLFVNKKVTNDILTSDSGVDKNPGVVKGMDIETVLKVDKSAVLNVIIDKKTGDNLRVQGEADLVFGLSPNGIMNLSGKYEVNSGHYEASLYNLVNRKFDIAKGSQIIWHGDPLEAEMDIRAIYKLNASASGLMASVTSGSNTATTNQYRRKMPFWVYLNLNGELLKPEISFNLDVPEGSRGDLGGQVYTQVQQLNNREEDLNKQVFSLLVLGQFFPSNVSDGSSGGTLSIARDNVNKALSNQLNNYSNKLTGDTGIEIGFELDSYTESTSQGEQNNTELNVSAQKRLFNDRLTVQVGSGFEIENKSKDDKTPIIGNVNIEYALTENRRYRLKGFHKNEFQSVIDGQVIVTGIAFLFNREFNKFRELWLKEQEKQEEDEK